MIVYFGDERFEVIKLVFVAVVIFGIFFVSGIFYGYYFLIFIVFYFLIIFVLK